MLSGYFHGSLKKCQNWSNINIKNDQYTCKISSGEVQYEN